MDESGNERGEGFWERKWFSDHDGFGPIDKNAMLVNMGKVLSEMKEALPTTTGKRKTQLERRIGQIQKSMGGLAMM